MKSQPMEVRLTEMLDKQQESSPALHLIPASDRRVLSFEKVFSFRNNKVFSFKFC